MRWFRPLDKISPKKRRRMLKEKIEARNIRILGELGIRGVLSLDEIRAIRRERNKALSQQQNNTKS